VDRTWHEIGADCQNTFSLIDGDGNVVGFGQALFRTHAPGTVHFARIIVSPAFRGKGVGRVLCQYLIEASSTLYQPSEFTLNVYMNNTYAIKLYKSLGFIVVDKNLEQNWFKMCMRLL